MGDEETMKLAIREELANVSFEDLMKLKNEFGKQAYNEAVFGVKKQPVILKRENKNRPREMSSKIKPKLKRQVPKKPTLCDPRFDRLCGEFNPKVFEKNYSFIKEMKEKEKGKLKRQLGRERNPQRKEQIQYLITRMENQEREKRKHEKLEEKKKKEQEERNQMLRDGIKPRYRSKSEKNILSLVERYEELKKSGKIHKAIEKYRKKNRKKDAQKMSQVK